MYYVKGLVKQKPHFKHKKTCFLGTSFLVFWIEAVCTVKQMAMLDEHLTAS